MARAQDTERPESKLNLPVFSKGCAGIDRMIHFRDGLRANPVDRELYARTKRALAQHEWKCKQNGPDAKTEIIEEIMLRLRKAGAAGGD